MGKPGKDVFIGTFSSTSGGESFSFSMEPIGDEKKYPYQDHLLPYAREGLEKLFKAHFDELFDLVGSDTFASYIEGNLEKTEKRFIQENKKEIKKDIYFHPSRVEKHLDSALFKSVKNNDLKEAYPLYIVSSPYLVYVTKGSKKILLRITKASPENIGDEEPDNRVYALKSYLDWLTKEEMVDFLLHGFDSKKILTNNLFTIALREKGERA